jgi:hypothetical protein
MWHILLSQMRLWKLSNSSKIITSGVEEIPLSKNGLGYKQYIWVEYEPSNKPHHSERPISPLGTHDTEWFLHNLSTHIPPPRSIMFVTILYGASFWKGGFHTS